MREKLYRFMQGRYGVDALGYFLMWFTMGVLILNMFVQNGFLGIAGTFLIFLTYYRMLSRNYSKRSAENTWYLKHTRIVRNRFNIHKIRMKIKRTHRIYACPHCRQKVKVPKGKGRIEISCPKCREKFIRRS